MMLLATASFRKLRFLMIAYMPHFVKVQTRFGNSANSGYSCIRFGGGYRGVSGTWASGARLDKGQSFQEPSPRTILQLRKGSLHSKCYKTAELKRVMAEVPALRSPSEPAGQQVRIRLRCTTVMQYISATLKPQQWPRRPPPASMPNDSQSYKEGVISKWTIVPLCRNFPQHFRMQFRHLQ